MARKRYRIITKFTYADGMPGGVLDGIVNSRRAVDTQLAANDKWLKMKGHTATETTITEVEKEEEHVTQN